MLDALFVRVSRRKDIKPDPNYRPEDAITGRRFLNPSATRLTVVFPPWHSTGVITGFMERRLVRRGWAVLAYDFHPQLLEADDKTVVRSFKYIQRTIADDLKKQTENGSYATIRLVSFSLGSVAQLLVAELYPEFTEIVMVVAGDDLAVCMWHGERTQGIRDAFEQNHMTLRQLTRVWSDIAPKNHIRRLHGKPVRLFLSRNDRIIATKNQLQLLEDMRRAGMQVKVSFRRTGHYMTVVRYCLFGF